MDLLREIGQPFLLNARLKLTTESRMLPLKLKILIANIHITVCSEHLINRGLTHQINLVM